MLTYEQAKAALLAGATLRGAKESLKDIARRGFGDRAERSCNGGETWYPVGTDVMSPEDGAYEIHTPAPAQPARDYRAERDALRLRLDAALDAIADLRAEAAYLSKPAADVAFWRDRAERAQAEVARLRERVAASELQFREVETSVSSLYGLVAHHMSLRAAREARDSRPAPKWPAVGDTAQWTTVWDHLQAEPQARYEAALSGTNRRHGLRMHGHAVYNDRGLFCGSRGNPAASEWTYTRLPDAETP